MKFVLVGNHEPATTSEKESRAKQAIAKAKSLGITIVQNHYTLGRFDAVTLIEAPGPEAVMQFSMWYAESGFGRIETLVALDPSTTR